MIQVGGSVVINCPLPQVFQFVTNAENDCHWVGFARQSRKLSPGAVGLGTKFRQEGAVMGLRVRTDWEITAFERDRRMRGEAFSGPAVFAGDYLFEPANGGTQVTKSGRIQFHGVLRLAEPVLGAVFQSALEADLKRLKHLLEQDRT